MNRHTRLVLALAAPFALATLTGCVGYGTYPGAEEPIEGASDPNQPNAERVMTEAMTFVLNRYRGTHSNQTVAINCPPGLRKVFYDRIAATVGSNVVPLTPEIVQGGTTPIYHVGRIALRYREAKVDIFRPTTEIGATPSGQPVYQCITVSLEGDVLKPWRVTDQRTYEPGVIPVPDYYYVPSEDRPDEFQRWRTARWPNARPTPPQDGRIRVDAPSAQPKPEPRTEPTTREPARPVESFSPPASEPIYTPPPAEPAPSPAPTPAPAPAPVAPIPAPRPAPQPTPQPAPSNPGDLVPIPPAKP